MPSAELIIYGLLNGFMLVFDILIAPLLIWVMIPGIIMSIIFKSRNASSIGSFLGLVGLFTVGPFS